MQCANWVGGNKIRDKKASYKVVAIALGRVGRCGIDKSSEGFRSE